MRKVKESKIPLVLIALFTFISNSNIAQFYDSDVYWEFDKFRETGEFKKYFENKNLSDSEVIYISHKIIDSIAYVLIDQYVRDSLYPINEMHWPIRIDAKDLSYPRTPDQQFYIMNTYGIWSPFYMGCQEDRSIKMFDSVLYNYIKIRNGADFFTRVIQESDSITYLGLGLSVPYIINDSSKTIEIIKNTLKFLDTVDFLERHYMPPHHLLLNFKNDTLISAHLAAPFIGGPVYPISDTCFDAQIYSELANYKWRGPRYLKQPISKSAVFEFDSSQLYIQMW